MENTFYLWLTEVPRFDITWPYSLAAAVASAKWLLLFAFALAVVFALASTRWTDAWQAAMGHGVCALCVGKRGLAVNVQNCVCFSDAWRVRRQDSGATPLNKTVEKLKEEFLAVLPPTFFFFVALHIVGLVRALMTEGTGLPVASSAQIALAALIFGKGVLLADLWPAINRFPQKPLIYNIAWKTVIYFGVASFIHYLERLYDFAKEAGGFVAGNQKLLAEIVWPHFLALQIVLLTLIFSYCVIREIGRAVGEERLFRLFFRQPATEVFKEREASHAPNSVPH